MLTYSTGQVASLTQLAPPRNDAMCPTRRHDTFYLIATPHLVFQFSQDMHYKTFHQGTRLYYRICFIYVIKRVITFVTWIKILTQDGQISFF